VEGFPQEGIWERGPKQESCDDLLRCFLARLVLGEKQQSFCNRGLSHKADIIQPDERVQQLTVSQKSRLG
jgi:hypothetical protein